MYYVGRVDTRHNISTMYELTDNVKIMNGYAEIGRANKENNTDTVSEPMTSSDGKVVGHRTVLASRISEERSVLGDND